MNRRVGKWMTGTAASLIVMIGAANGAMAGINCDAYAKLSLQQAKQNVDRRCGYTGPRWSLDLSRHRNWCQEVGPTVWRGELKLRNDMLGKCK